MGESYGTTVLPISSVPPLSEGDEVSVSSSKCGCITETIKQIFSVPYNPHPEDISFLTRAQAENKDDINVKVAVLSSKESRHIFGRPLYRRGIQPVWIEVTNNRGGPLLLDRVRLDPNYFPPLEAAMISHLGNVTKSFGARWFTLFNLFAAPHYYSLHLCAAPLCYSLQVFCRSQSQQTNA